jgi:cyclic-di-GMP-binding protein
MPSFDVVSSVDTQEVRNAVDQASREIQTRYDFKDSKSSFTLKEQMIILVADDRMKLASLQEILKQKLSKRGVSLKSVDFKDETEAGGNTLRQEVHVKEGLTDEELKKLNKVVKSSKLKVTTQIQGNQLRVTGKKKDDLQVAIQTLRAEIKDIDLQFVNFRD